jgi:hypothetical protein
MSEKYIVTDGKLLELAIKQNELFTRAKKGVYENLDEVLANLQVLIEGKKPQVIPTARESKALTVWKTIQIGGMKPAELAKEVPKHCEEVSNWAQNLMKQKAFTTLDAKEDVMLVVLTPADLGFKKSPRTDEFMTAEFLAKWSAENLDGYVLELCPAEVGPQLRIQYEDQPKSEYLWIVMERITDSDGHPDVFRVERRGDGDRWLGTDCARVGGGWNLGGRLVFRLRKVQS